MGRIFNLTAASTTLEQFPDTRGEVAISVALLGSFARPMRLRVAADKHAEYFELSPADEHSLHPGKPLEAKLSVKLPASAVYGEHQARVIAYLVDGSDEDWDELVFTVRVVPRPAPPPWLTRAKLIAILAVAGVVVLGAIAAIFLTRCPEGQARCDGRCVDLFSAETDCGACGTACPAMHECADARCVQASCPDGMGLCGGQCVDLVSSTSHCKTCDNRCSADEVCSPEGCVLGRCPQGQVLCAGACRDVRADSGHCGACGVACSDGQQCQGGACVLTSCPRGQQLCGGECVSMDDRAHCGMCGNACAEDSDCTDRTCVRTRCRAGATLCNGRCVDVAGDPANCGACGNVCAAGAACSGGSCQFLCAGHETLCGGRCVDLMNDSANCGACRQRCPTRSFCSGGGCEATCPSGQVECFCGGEPVCAPRALCERCNRLEQP